MAVKNLKKAYLRVSVETPEQFEQACAVPYVDLIYIDSGLFRSEAFPEMAEKAHKGTGGFGKLFGLRLPQIWRSRTEEYFESRREQIFFGGFDVYLAGNPEEVLWLNENNIGSECIILNHCVYRFNELSDSAIDELCGTGHLMKTWSLELNARECEELSAKLREKRVSTGELTVYGRANLMVTAQCIRKTGIGCDRRPSLLWLRDRTGALMPVRNCCAFCCNTIYNSVPTAIFDMEKEIGRIAPDSVRYEFTTETASQMKEILSGKMPVSYTRGHFKRGVL